MATEFEMKWIESQINYTSKMLDKINDLCVERDKYKYQLDIIREIAFDTDFTLTPEGKKSRIDRICDFLSIIKENEI